MILPALQDFARALANQHIPLPAKIEFTPEPESTLPPGSDVLFWTQVGPIRVVNPPPALRAELEDLRRLGARRG